MINASLVFGVDGDTKETLCLIYFTESMGNLQTFFVNALHINALAGGVKDCQNICKMAELFLKLLSVFAPLERYINERVTKDHESKVLVTYRWFHLFLPKED